MNARNDHQHPQTMGHSPRPHSSAHSTDTAARAIDPVCGMTVAVDSPHTAEHAGQAFKFCCAGCRTKFLKEPTRYVSAASSAREAIPPARAATPSPNVAAG